MADPADPPDDLVETVLASASPAERERLLTALLAEADSGLHAAVEESVAGIATAGTADAVADEAEPAVSALFGTDRAVVYRYDGVDDAFVSAARTEAAVSDPAPVTPDDVRLWAAFRGDEPTVVSGDGEASLVLPVTGIGTLGIAGVDAGTIAATEVALADRLARVAVGVADLKRRLEDRRETVEQLREENEQLRDFANIVSHDLRNPLAVARGFLDLAIEEGDEEYVEKVEEAHDRIESIVEHTLALAREGEQVGDTIPVDLETVARRAWSVVESPDAALVVEESATLDADPDRLQQCFENLFRNSVEHGASDEGAGDRDGAEPAVTVSVGPLHEGFYVEDDGPGIPTEERETVFERGYSGGEDGTGIGLDMVRGIVEAHRWSIELVESAEGGARFEIRT